MNAIASLILTAVGVLASSFISYGLGASVRGTLGLLALVISLAVTIGSLGAPDALLVYFAGLGAPSTRYALRVSALAATGAGLAGAVLAAVASLIASEGSLWAAVVFAGLCASTTALWMLPNALLLSNEDFLAWNLVRLAGGCGWLVAVLLGVWVDRLTSSSTLAVLAIAGAFAMMNAGVWAACLILLSRRVQRQSASRPRPRFIVAFGVPTSVALTLVILNARVDQFFVASSSTPEVLGQYVAAAAYASLLVLGVQALGNLAYPRMAQNPQRSRRVLMRYTRLALALSLVILVPLWLLASEILVLLNGPEFPDSALFARILLFGACFQAVAGVLEQGLKALGHPKRYLLAEAVGLGLTVVLIAAVAGRGAVWVATASVAGSAVTLAVVAALVAWRMEPANTIGQIS